MTKNKIQIDQFLQSIEKTKRICDIQSKFQMQNSSLIAYNEVFYSLNTTMSIITESASKTCLNNISSLNISAHFDPLIQFSEKMKFFDHQIHKQLTFNIDIQNQFLKIQNTFDNFANIKSIPESIDLTPLIDSLVDSAYYSNLIIDEVEAEESEKVFHPSLFDPPKETSSKKNKLFNFFKFLVVAITITSDLCGISTVFQNDPQIQQEVLRRTTEIISNQQKIEEELERNNLLLEQLIEHTSD